MRKKVAPVGGVSTLILVSAAAWAQSLTPPPSLPPPAPPPASPPGALQAPLLEAGGLAPPPAAPAPAPPEVVQTEQTLTQAEQQDSGRGLQFFWVHGAVGVEHVGLHTLSGANLIDTGTHEPVQTGLAYGGSLGVRLLAFSVGARFQMLSASDYQLWTLGGRFGLHVPVGSLEPHAYVGGGYAAAPGADAPSIDGVNVFAGGGLDVYLSSVVSVGADLTGDLFFLSRAAAPTHAVVAYREGESSVGLGGSLCATLGLHF